LCSPLLGDPCKDANRKVYENLQSSHVLLDLGVPDHARIGHGTTFKETLPISSPRRAKCPSNRTNPQKISLFSEPPSLHAAHIPSTIPGSAGQVAPGVETTCEAQIVSAFGAPFTLEGLSEEAGAEAMGAEPVGGPPQTMWAWMSKTMRGSGAAGRGMIVYDNKNRTSTP